MWSNAEPITARKYKTLCVTAVDVAFTNNLNSQTRCKKHLKVMMTIYLILSFRFTAN